MTNLEEFEMFFLADFIVVMVFAYVPFFAGSLMIGLLMVFASLGFLYSNKDSIISGSKQAKKISEDLDPNRARNLAVTSTLLKIQAMVLIFFAALLYVGMIVSVVNQPLASIVCLLGGSACLIAARDLFVMSSNVSQVAHNLKKMEQGSFWDALSAAGSIIYNGYEEYTSGMPIIIKNTWIAIPIYKLVTKIKKSLY
jgi:small-conductance mechanosensitive channel